MKELGGRRKKLRDDSPNLALRNESFRNYADYMMTDERPLREHKMMAEARLVDGKLVYDGGMLL